MQTYAINYDAFLCEFLHKKNINHFITDADIIVIKLDDINDTSFFNLIKDFKDWLPDNGNDMTLNKSGNGSLYHVKNNLSDKERILTDIKNDLHINLSPGNIAEYYDIVYDYMMYKYGETAKETENIIDNLFK